METDKCTIHIAQYNEDTGKFEPLDPEQYGEFIILVQARDRHYWTVPGVTVLDVLEHEQAQEDN